MLDLMLPGIGGLPALKEFARVRPELPIIMLSSSEDPRNAREAFANGALGYVPKSSSRYALLSAIKIVLNDDLYVPKLLVEQRSERRSTFASQAGASLSLTERQIEVLRLVSEAPAQQDHRGRTGTFGEDRQNSHHCNI
ncbi:response regulator [Paraburkholderia sejongensis]|uniref:response regulator n=1 Tax=Paraburkholderia sejongensis TaxID=2886946 RepID=UPI001E5B04FB|nr:response regulator transcription factor [Paraburkholderia sp. MMS20-SJTR3]